MLIFWGKFSVLSPGPIFVELVKMNEKIICPVPEKEKDEETVGWAVGCPRKDTRSLLLLGSAVNSLVQRCLETGNYGTVSVYAGS